MAVVPIHAALVIGAQPLWSTACVATGRWDAGDPGCQRSEDRLHYSDDDAWRVATVLRATYGREHVAVLTRVDDSTAALPDRERIPDLSEVCGDQVLGLSCVASATAHLYERAGGAPLVFTVYFSGHGSGGRLDLEDGVWSEAELVATIERAAPGSSVDLFMADACDSAETKGTAAPVTRPIAAAKHAALELLVFDTARYVDQARGSTFTAMVMSAYAGGAEGTSARAIREYLDVNETRFDLATEVRSTDRRDDITVGAFSPSARDGFTLDLPAAPAATRWLVQRVVRQPNGDTDYWLYYDVVSTAAVTLRVPPGTWRVSRIAESELQRWLYGGLHQVIGFDCGTHTGGGGDHETVRPGTTLDILPDVGGKGVDEADPAARVLAPYLLRVANHAPRAAARRHRPFSGLRTDVGLGFTSSSLGRERPLFGPALRVTQDLEWIELGVEADARWEVGPVAEPSEESHYSGTLFTDFTVPFMSTSALRVGLGLGVGGGTIVLDGGGTEQAGPFVSARVGPSAAWRRGRWTLVLNPYATWEGAFTAAVVGPARLSSEPVAMGTTLDLGLLW